MTVGCSNGDSNVPQFQNTFLTCICAWFLPSSTSNDIGNVLCFARATSSSEILNFCAQISPFFVQLYFSFFTIAWCRHIPPPFIALFKELQIFPPHIRGNIFANYLHDSFCIQNYGQAAPTKWQPLKKGRERSTRFPLMENQIWMLQEHCKGHFSNKTRF